MKIFQDGSLKHMMFTSMSKTNIVFQLRAQMFRLLSCADIGLLLHLPCTDIPSQDALDRTGDARNNLHDFSLRALDKQSQDTTSLTNDVHEHLQSTRQLMTDILLGGVGRQLVTHETDVQVRRNTLTHSCNIHLWKAKYIESAHVASRYHDTPRD